MFLRPRQIKPQSRYEEIKQPLKAMDAMRRAAIGGEAARLFAMQDVEIDTEGWNNGVEFLAQLRDMYGASPEDIEAILEHHNIFAFWNLDCHEWTLPTQHTDYWQNWNGPSAIERHRGPILYELTD